MVPQEGVRHHRLMILHETRIAWALYWEIHRGSPKLMSEFEEIGHSGGKLEFIVG